MNKAASQIADAPSLSLVPSPVEEMLKSFDEHSLYQQDRAALMTRVDDKYIVRAHHLPAILEFAREHYSVLTQNHTHIFDYETAYYDTPDYLFYHMHHAGKANRLKVRVRQYVQAKLSFLEIKQKNNKGITHKYRHKIDQSQKSLAIEDDHLNQVTNEALSPALQVDYQRITLMHKTLNQRITLDLNLNFSDLRGSHTHDLSNLVIIEIKRDKGDHNLLRSNFHLFLHKLGYQPHTFSKYCMGCVLTNVDSIKNNNFKSNILHLKSLYKESHND